MFNHASTACLHCSLMHLLDWLFVDCVALSDEERNENCQHLLASDEDSDGKISPSEVCQRRFKKNILKIIFSQKI